MSLATEGSMVLESTRSVPLLMVLLGVWLIMSSINSNIGVPVMCMYDEDTWSCDVHV